jgi:hypothetical protein
MHGIAAQLDPRDSIERTPTPQPRGLRKLLQGDATFRPTDEFSAETRPDSNHDHDDPGTPPPRHRGSPRRR